MVLPKSLDTASRSRPLVLACMEVWGGNRSAARAVSLPDLEAWVFSRPFAAATVGGDVYYLSVCDGGLLSRIALADVSGHGEKVDVLAQQLLQLMRRHINTWDQSDFVRKLDDAVGLNQAVSHYASAVVVSFDRSRSELAFTVAGHPPPLWFRSGSGEWTFLEHRPSLKRGPAGLPLGLIAGTQYRQDLIPFPSKDILVIYSDGLSEAENGEGEQFGSTRLLEVARTLPTDSAPALGEGLMWQLRSFRDGTKPGDDQTLIVLRNSRDSS